MSACCFPKGRVPKKGKPLATDAMNQIRLVFTLITDSNSRDVHGRSTVLLTKLLQYAAVV